MRLIDELRARLRLRFAPRAAESRMQEETRDGRGLAWLSGLRLDLKLGARMLLRYPVLTLASVLALAVAVALAASWFEFMTDITRPRLPFPDADRIVGLQNIDVEAAAAEPRSLHDFELWRQEARSLAELGAASPLEYNVITEDRRYATLSGARVTASTFRITRAEPLFGRTLTAADERPDAAQVAVIGYSAWQRLFDGDRSVIGRTIRLGAEHATVVGVMPEGFGFPTGQEVWTPLRERASSYAPREGPPVKIFGRLAPGASLEEARVELETIGRRAAAEFPATHQNLRPEIRRITAMADEAVLAIFLNIPGRHHERPGSDGESAGQ